MHSWLSCMLVGGKVSGPVPLCGGSPLYVGLRLFALGASKLVCVAECGLGVATLGGRVGVALQRGLVSWVVTRSLGRLVAMWSVAVGSRTLLFSGPLFLFFMQPLVLKWTWEPNVQHTS